MKLTAYIANILLLLALPAWGQTQMRSSVGTPSDSALSGDWKISLGGQDTQDAQSQSKTVGFALELRAQYLLTSALSFDVQPALRLESGQTQSIDGADSTENKIVLNQAAVHYRPFKTLSFSAGALQQQDMHNRLLTDRLAFPAIRSSLGLESGNLNSSVEFESAIPTSNSLSANTRELEPAPSLNSAALALTWKASEKSFWKSRIGFFSFKNLPSAVAEESSLLGNKVNELSEADYELTYEHEGLEASTELSLPLTHRLYLLTEVSYLNNTKAPSEYAAASYFSAGAEYIWSSQFTWALKAGYFSVAPEAAVSYFNARGFETNRIGYVAESIMKFNKERFSLSLKYTDAELMYQSINTTQSRERMLMIKLETSYASI